MNINLQRPRSVFEARHQPLVGTLICQQPQFPTQPIHKPINPQTKPFRSSTPLSSRFLSLPPQITQFCESEGIPYQPYGFDSHGHFFWLSIHTTFFIWRYNHIHQWGPTPPQPQLMFVSNFNQPIAMAKVGAIRGYQYNSQTKFDVLAIALANKIIFLSFDKHNQQFENMKMQVGTNGEIIQDMVFHEGNIYYCGSQGSLKVVFNKPGFFRKQTKLRMKSSSFLSDTLLNSMLFWRMEVNSSSLVIIGDYAYTLVEKKYPNSWIAKKLIYKTDLTEERFIRIFDINTNELIREIQEQVIVDKAKFKTLTNVDFVRKVKIIGLFQRDQRLGVSFSSGMFAYLNRQGLMVEDTNMIPLAHPNNIVAEKIDREFDIAGTVMSLGFQSLSLFQNSGIGYVDNNSFDLSYSTKGKDVMRIVELSPRHQEYNHTLFEEPRQWMCLNSAGVVQIKRLRLQEVILVYLQILSQERSIRNSVYTFEPFNHLCRVYTNVEVCSYLMEIICTNDLEIQIEEQAYQNTRQEIFNFKSHQRLHIEPLDDKQSISSPITNRTIRINEDIIKIAAEILNYISSQDLNSEIDVLWRAILRYFNAIYDLIKHRTPSWCTSHFEVIEFVKYKLGCFKKLLYIKALELNIPDWKHQDSPLSLTNARPNHNIPPMGTSPRSKYDTNTPILIVRTKELIDKINCLLQTCLLLKHNPDKQEQPTIHQILVDGNTRNSLRSRIFKDIQSDNPVILKLIKVFPDLLNYSDQIFNQFILNPKSKTCSFSLQDLVPTLKIQRVQIIKQYFYKEKRIYDFVVLLIQRMKHLQLQKHTLKTTEGIKELPFAEYDVHQRELRIQELEDNWRVMVERFEESLRDYISEIRKNKCENRLGLLGNYIKSLDIEPITEFTKEIFLEEGLAHLIQELAETQEKIELKPKPLYEWK